MIYFIFFFNVTAEFPSAWSHWDYGVFLQKCLCQIPQSYWDRLKPILHLIETVGTDPVVSLRPRNSNFAYDYLE
jgi:hypothetical protein